MANTYMTPGVYIEEKNAFSGSAVAVETAVPVFIGYTEKADRNGKSLLNKPTRITSLAMYDECFGGGFKSKFTIEDPSADSLEAEKLIINGKQKVVKIKDKHKSFMFNAIRLFYYNGGSACYIHAVDTYGNTPDGFDIDTAKFNAALPILEKEYEPTLVVMPDIISKGPEAYDVYQQVLLHCQKMQSRFALLDVYHKPGNRIEEDVALFRSKIGSNALNYGAAYYPFLKTSVVLPTEVDHNNLDIIASEKSRISKEIEENKKLGESTEQTKILANLKKELVDLDTPPDEIETDLTNANSTLTDANSKLAEAKSNLNILQNTEVPAKSENEYPKNLKSAESAVTDLQKGSETAEENLKTALEIKHQDKVGLKRLLPVEERNGIKVLDNYLAISTQNNGLPSPQTFHQSLKAVSPTYNAILEEMRRQLNELPPSAAIAGVYTYTDTTRGVWKSPANVSVSMVNEPALNVSHEEQQNLNVDAITGKSINVIRSFPGLGTLVWGARTLDGNSQDWRYVNVRRTLIMIEQSIKLATRAYVFEANDANTWVTVTSMINNFLYNLWKQGALAGASPDQAYNVQLGLGSTMTPNDILDGIMRISIHLAIVRPAEFIVITFQQQQQQS